MNIKSLIDKWIAVTEYDESQTAFNLFSANYSFHRSGELAKKLMTWDSSGKLTILYLKSAFETICKDIRISLIDLLKNPDTISDYQDMWNNFESDDFITLEQSLIKSIVDITNMTKSIGEIDKDRELDLFRDNIEYVAEELPKCELEAYNITPNTKIIDNIKFHPVIEIGNTLTEILMKVQQSNDGLYLCYITDFNSCGAYFTYLLKSGETIIGINDRIDESYVGQHCNSRNNRFIEDKKWHIFPYNDIIEPEGEDYLGYATSLKCGIDALSIQKLSSNFKYTVILTASLIIQRFQSQNTNELKDIPIVYIDALLRNNAKLAETQALIPMNGQLSPIVLNNRNLKFDFNSENIKSNELQSKFDYDYKTPGKGQYTGTYTDVNSIFIDLYGDGFKLDPSKILVRKYPELTSGNDNEPAPVISEFVGPKEKLELEYYRQARSQLANYIIDKMAEEYHNFGGNEGVMHWYEQAVKKNKDDLIMRCVKWYKDYLDGAAKSDHLSPWAIPAEDDLCVTLIESADPYIPRQNRRFILNSTVKYKPNTYNPKREYLCPITGKTANMWFVFQPNTYQNMELLIGQEVPKILKGFRYSGSRYSGNSLLHSCDPVGGIRSPFSTGCRYQNKFNHIIEEPFMISVGLSKLGLNKLLKSLNT